MCVGVALLAVYLRWQFFQPKIKLASDAQIVAVLPKELLVETPVDRDAQSRYRRFMVLVNSIAKKDLIALYGLKPLNAVIGGPTRAPRAIQWTDPILLARHYLSKASPIYAKADQIVDSGPFQVERTEQSRPGTSSNSSMILRGYIQTLLLCASSMADAGDFRESTRLIASVLKLNDRLFRKNNDVADYLANVSFDAMAMTSIQKNIEAYDFPIDACSTLLNELEPAPKTDTYLSDALRTDFQVNLLRRLGRDPVAMFREVQMGDSIAKAEDIDDDFTNRVGSLTVAGTFDVLETSKLLGKAELVGIRNSEKPLSQYDASMDRALELEGTGLPEPNDEANPQPFQRWWDRVKYRTRMNCARNSMGRRIAGALGSRKSAISLSCRWRAIHDATRVLLASRIYRASHGGSLPNTGEGFLPMLGEWPQDPFNGKPMIYSRINEKVYAVGDNLVDDGGKIEQHGFELKDVGVSIKR